MKKLGFGLMRLPLIDKNDNGSIDIELTKKMVDVFMERGFTYFDTAWMYCKFNSERAIKEALECDAYIAAICAAPMILGELMLLDGKEAICYPGFEDKLIGATVSAKKVVRDGKILTAKGMGAALDFGLMIVEIFKGKEIADSLRTAVIAD